MSVFIGYASFMAYQMMKGKKDNNDGFPSIPGMIARYSALGLTNEQMAANPVWVDKTGNGHDLQMKNFAWGGMSGCDGYTESFLGDKINWKSEIHNSRKMSVFEGDRSKVSVIHNQYHFQTYVKISGINDNEGKVRGVYFYNMESNFTKGTICRTDGIYKIDITESNKRGVVGIWAYPAKKNEDVYDYPVTIEILPLYPGALVFDGVDDWAGCDNLPLLPKEKGYSIIALRNWITRYDATQYKRPLISNLDTNDKGAFLIEYRKDENVNDVTGSYNSFTDVYIDDNNPITWQTSSSYNGQIIKKGTSKSTNKLCICKTYFGQLSNYANAAIWEIVILDHDATEEELTKIKDYFVKTYPWLFPDQAWTVTGKTNEDEDRATIANITGNGNGLILSNFGFAEGSGYGLYYQYFGNEFKATNGEIEGGGWNIIDNYNISHDKRIPINSIGKCFWGKKALVNGIKLRFKLTGMTEGDVLAFGYAATYDPTYTSDGIYAIDLPPVDKSYGFSLQSSLTENLPTTPVTIELLPFEYEGYLVTDGVDDTGRAVNLTISKDFTLVGEWILFSKTSVNAGLSIHPQIHIFNRPEAIQIVFRTAGKTLPVKSLKAICSDGRCYDENWSELKINVGEFTDNKGTLFVASNGTNYAQIAFKNLGIYNNQILSKDECLKAYNYLQTLKAK